MGEFLLGTSEGKVAGRLPSLPLAAPITLALAGAN